MEAPTRGPTRNPSTKPSIKPTTILTAKPTGKSYSSCQQVVEGSYSGDMTNICIDTSFVSQ